MPSKTFTISDTTPATASTALGGVARGLDAYDAFLIDADLVGATGGVLDVYLQRKVAADTWRDWLHFPQLTAGGAAVKYSVSTAPGIANTIVVVGVGADASATPALAANTFIGGAPGRGRSGRLCGRHLHVGRCRHRDPHPWGGSVVSEAVQFEFTPLGVVQVGAAARPSFGDQLVAAGAALAASPEPVQPIQQAPLKAHAPGVSPGAVVSPKHIVRAAKQRVNDIRQELKRMRALQSELAQLENLLIAAKKPRHLAEVRQLSNRK